MGTIRALSLFDSGYLVMLRACFDDSGTHPTSPVSTVGGYVADIETWDRFQKQWATIVRSLKDLGFLRMADYGREEHVTGTWSKRKQDRILRAFAKAIIGPGIIGMAYSVPTATYEAGISPENRIAFGNPYTGCAIMCIATVELLARSWSYNGPIQYVFEDGNRRHELLAGHTEAFKRNQHVSTQRPQDLRASSGRRFALVPLAGVFLGLRGGRP